MSHAKIRLTCRLLVSLSDESFAQHRVFADQLSTCTPRCGPYECMADQVLALIEAQADFQQLEITGRSAQVDFSSPMTGRARSADPRAIQSTGAKAITL